MMATIPSVSMMAIKFCSPLLLGSSRGSPWATEGSMSGALGSISMRKTGTFVNFPWKTREACLAKRDSLVIKLMARSSK